MRPPNALTTVPPPAPRNPRLLIHDPHFRCWGGGELVGAWIIAALQNDYEILLHASAQPDWTAWQQRFGVQIDPALVQWIPAPSMFHFSRIGTGRAQTYFRQRRARHLIKLEKRFSPDLWLHPNNMAWLPHRGWQYILYPVTPWTGSHSLRRRWFNRLQTLLAGGDWEQRGVPAERHISVADSNWTAQKIAVSGFSNTAVITPPVAPLPCDASSPQRKCAALMIGRWAPEKNLPLALSVVEAVRARGVPIELHLAGFWDFSPSRAHEARAIRAQAANQPWVHWHEGLSRQALGALAERCRFGLHTMHEEHFGIAVAELLGAGCIPVVPDSGGPPDIVRDTGFCFRNETEAVDQLVHLAQMSEPEQEAFATRGRERARAFAPEVFCKQIRSSIDQSLATLDSNRS